MNFYQGQQITTQLNPIKFAIKGYDSGNYLMNFVEGLNSYQAVAYY